MRFVFVVDSFKGSLTSGQIHKILDKTAHEVFPDCYCRSIEIADGGEGTLEAILKVRKGNRISCQVQNPLFQRMEASYGILEDGTGIVEMAAASGLSLIPYKEGNALYTSSYGTGQLILHAIEQGCKKILVTVGGSSTNDGGMGAMQALGVIFRDKNQEALEPIGLNLEKVESIDLSGLDPRAKNVDFKVLCDVNNPIVGAQGATRIYGPQKGANGKTNDQLEQGMLQYLQCVELTFGRSFKELSGGGAAGGLGMALHGFLGATIIPGMDTMMELTGVKEAMKDSDYIITGEGKIDNQSFYGKVVGRIGYWANRYQIPAIALCGVLEISQDKLREKGIARGISLVKEGRTREEAMERAAELLDITAKNLFSTIKRGNSSQPEGVSKT